MAIMRQWHLPARWRQQRREMPLFRFENFTTANAAQRSRVCLVFGGWKPHLGGHGQLGLAVYENHSWKTYNTTDGLAQSRGNLAGSG